MNKKRNDDIMDICERESSKKKNKKQCVKPLLLFVNFLTARQQLKRYSINDSFTIRLFIENPKIMYVPQLPRDSRAFSIYINPRATEIMNSCSP